MTHAEIAANARKPYAAARLKVTQERHRNRRALENIAAYRDRGPVAAAQLIALAAIEIRDDCTSAEADERAKMHADLELELGPQFDPR